MFSKQESRRLREEFWIAFGKSFPKKWILYKTKIKGVSFKFHFDLKTAIVSLDIEGDLERRILIWEKLMSLKLIFLENYLSDAIFDDSYILENKKEVSRIYVVLENVSIHNKNTWQETMVFLQQKMDIMEAFFEQYKDIIEN